MDYDTAFEKLIGHEGGYVSAEKAKANGDPGGETNFGISKRAYPEEDIAKMTFDRAKYLYARDYWQPSGCNILPEGVRFHVFDMAVNSGVRSAIKALQTVLGVEVDGVLGPITLAAANGMDPIRLSTRLSGVRLMAMTDLWNWQNNSKGWARRIAKNLMEA